MKNLRYIPIWITLTVLSGQVLAQSGPPGLVSGGKYRLGSLGSINQPRPIRQSSDTVYDVGTYPLHTTELAQGEGREIIQIYCRFCHSTTYITMQPPLPAATWETEVYKMINTYGAPIPEDAAKLITTYLQSHYTQETRKQ